MEAELQRLADWQALFEGGGGGGGSGGRGGTSRCSVEAPQAQVNSSYNRAVLDAQAVDSEASRLFVERTLELIKVRLDLATYGSHGCGQVLRPLLP